MYIDFTILSTDNNLTDLKQLFPSSNLFLKGDKLKSGKIMPYNEFTLIFEQHDIYYIDKLLSSFKNYMGKCLEELFNYMQTNKLMSSVCIVIKETKEDPAISISNENLIFLCKLNANLDFDFI